MARLSPTATTSTVLCSGSCRAPSSVEKLPRLKDAWRDQDMASKSWQETYSATAPANHSGVTTGSITNFSASICAQTDESKDSLAPSHSANVPCNPENAHLSSLTSSP